MAGVWTGLVNVGILFSCFIGGSYCHELCHKVVAEFLGYDAQIDFRGFGLANQIDWKPESNPTDTRAIAAAPLAIAAWLLLIGWLGEIRPDMWVFYPLMAFWVGLGPLVGTGDLRMIITGDATF